MGVGVTSKSNPVMYIFSPEGSEAHRQTCRETHVKFEFQDDQKDVFCVILAT